MSAVQTAGIFYLTENAKMRIINFNVSNDRLERNEQDE